MSMVNIEQPRIHQKAKNVLDIFPPWQIRVSDPCRIIYCAHISSFKLGQHTGKQREIHCIQSPNKSLMLLCCHCYH